MPDIRALDKLRDFPAAVAVVDEAGSCDWLELFEGALDLARLFKEKGLLPGSHAAVLPANRREYFQALLGAVLAGVWLTPLNNHLTAPEMDYVLEDSEAKLLLLMSDNVQLQSTVAQHKLVQAQSDQPPRDAATVLDELDGMMGGVPGGALMYTSGTTGRPKGVKRASPQTVAATLGSWSRLGEGIGLDGAGCHLVTGPVYHAAPGLYALYDLLNGARVILMPQWDSEACLAAIEQYRVTHTHLVPTMFVRLLREREQFSRTYDLSSLTLVLHGAAAIAPEVKRAMIDWWGPLLVEYWGASESGIITRVDSCDWLTHPGTVGLPLEQYQVSVRDEDFAVLPAGEVGMLFARRDGMPRPFEYFKDSAKTASCYQGDWFNLGDMGWQDAGGYVYIADRRSNLIISGGVNIYPAEVENALQAHPGVSDVVVIGVDDKEWGKRVHAIIQAVDPAGDHEQLESDLRGFVAERLAGFKRPRSWEFVRQLPRFESGKLYRNRLDTAG
jgi:long-chain acyl-CoA synthetase